MTCPGPQPMRPMRRIHAPAPRPRPTSYRLAPTPRSPCAHAAHHLHTASTRRCGRTCCLGAWTTRCSSARSCALTQDLEMLPSAHSTHLRALTAWALRGFTQASRAETRAPDAPSVSCSPSCSTASCPCESRALLPAIAPRPWHCLRHGIRLSSLWQLRDPRSCFTSRCCNVMLSSTDKA